MHPASSNPPSKSVDPQADARPELEAVISGERFVCSDGDVIGRQGTVGVSATGRLIAMSRRHLAVEWQKENWQVTLLPTAKNVTLLDGSPMVRETPCLLMPGNHLIDIEGSVFVLRVNAPVNAADPLAPDLPPGLKRLRKEFGGSDGLLRLIAENVADLIAVIDHEGKRVWNNAAYFTCLGYPAAEISESYSMAELHPDDLPLVKSTFEESMATGVGQRLEYRMRHRNGHWVHLESQGRVVESANGAGKYLVLVARDVTARKQAEQRARQRLEQLTARTATLTQFTQSSHFQEGKLEVCFAAITEAAVQHLDCERASVWLFSADKTALRCTDSFELQAVTHGQEEIFRADAFPQFFAAVRAERCLAADEAASDERLQELRGDYFHRYKVNSFLAARIGLGNDVLGMLALERTESANPWNLEDENFAVSLADTLLMSLNAHEQAEAFAALQQSQRQIASDLADASAYVHALLPEYLTGAVESEWRTTPCTSLGGDGLGHYWLDEKHLAIYLIDSVGHGINAALMAISVMNMLRSRSLPDADFHDPAQVLRSLNRAFQMESQNNMFFTIWYGVYHQPSREIVYAVAGHPPAVLYHANDSHTLLGGEGLMIGADSESVYVNARAVVPTPGLLYVFSDGVFEILDSAGAAWSFDAFLAHLAAPPPPGLSKLDDMHLQAQRVHGRPELPDDFSIMKLVFH